MQIIKAPSLPISEKKHIAPIEISNQGAYKFYKKYSQNSFLAIKLMDKSRHLVFFISFIRAIERHEEDL